MAEFEPSLSEGLASVLFWSDDRTAAAVAASALARRAGGTTYWLNLRSPGGGRDEFEEIISPFVNHSAQYHTTGPFEIRSSPQDAPTGCAESFLPSTVISPLIARALDGLRHVDGRKVLLITNCDRLSPTLVEDPEALRQLIVAVGQAGVKLIVAHTDPPRCAGVGFGAVIRIDVLPGREWHSGMLAMEEPRSSPAPPPRRSRLELLDSVKPFLNSNY
jgi:hypothetical protein